MKVIGITTVVAVVALSGCQATSLQQNYNEAVDGFKKGWEKSLAASSAAISKSASSLEGRKDRAGKPFNAGAKVHSIDGFRTFKWSSLPDNMTQSSIDGLITYYQYNGQLKTMIGGAQLSKIEFGYLENRLHSVVLHTGDDTNGQALLTALDSTFGKGMSPDQSHQKPWRASYQISNSPYKMSNNVFHYDKDNGWGEFSCESLCKVTFYSKHEELNRQTKFASQAQNAEGDF